MSQHFDDIQVSDKGMIKLIRNNGKDYIFPAADVISVENIETTNNGIGGHGLITNFYDYLSPKTKSEIGLSTKNGYFVIGVAYSHSIASRIEDAKTISNRIAVKKYGNFY